jgi:hypothetical protein
MINSKLLQRLNLERKIANLKRDFYLMATDKYSDNEIEIILHSRHIAMNDDISLRLNIQSLNTQYEKLKNL